MPNNQDKEALLNALLDLTDPDDSDMGKYASDFSDVVITGGNPAEVTEKLASISEAMGKIAAQHFVMEQKKQQVGYLKTLGLDPESIKTAGLSSSPQTDMMSQTIAWIMKKIHPIMMMGNYRPGAAYNHNSNNIDPDKHPMGKEDTVVADKARKGVGEPSSTFGLKKKNK